jgi:hypothetical protein
MGWVGIGDIPDMRHQISGPTGVRDIDTWRVLFVPDKVRSQRIAHSGD